MSAPFGDEPSWPLPFHALPFRRVTFCWRVEARPAGSEQWTAVHDAPLEWIAQGAAEQYAAVQRRAGNVCETRVIRLALPGMRWRVERQAPDGEWHWAAEAPSREIAESLAVLAICTNAGWDARIFPIV